MKGQISHLKKVFAGHWPEMAFILIAIIAGLFVVAWLATQMAGRGLVVALLAISLVLTFMVALFRFNTFQQLDMLRRQAETSGALGREITANLDLSALLQEIALLVQSRFGYDAILLGLLNESYVVTQLAQVGKTAYPLSAGSQLTAQEAMGVAASRQQVVWVNTTASQPPGIRPNLLPGMHSELVLPLVVAQKLLGVMDIQSRVADVFDADHILVLQSLAAQTAVTIRNTTLYQREVGRRHLAETLYDIGLALSGTLNREEVLGLILEQLASVVPYDRAALLLHRNHELEFVAARGFPKDSQPLQIRISLHREDESDIFLTIHRTKKPLVVPDVSQLPSWTHVEGLPIARSWLGVPLLHQDEVIGMLSLVRETADAYSGEDTIPATTFAVQAAVALHNAELYNRIDQFNRQLAYEVEQRTEAVLQLARLDQAKSDFIDIAAHELRTPLTTIKGYSQMLLQELPATQNTHYRELASAILRGANRLHEIVNNMLNVAKIDNETLDLFFQRVSLPHVFERVCQEQQEVLAERNLTLTIEPMIGVPDIEADVDALYTVFSHLLINAIKYTPDGGSVTISHQMMSGGETAVPSHIEIVISDTGIGIPLEAQELIFAKFYQTGKVALHSSGKTKFKGGGPGLGLAIVRGIVEAHHGKVWANSPGYDEQILPGSQFHIVLPIKQP